MKKQHRLDPQQRLQSYASAWRMMLYLVMALLVLELADIPSWATMPVFLLFLCFDPGKTVVGLQESGWSNLKIVARLILSVLPLIAVSAVAFAWHTEPVPTGITALAALLFYIWDRQNLENKARVGLEEIDSGAEDGPASEAPEDAS